MSEHTPGPYHAVERLPWSWDIRAADPCHQYSCTGELILARQVSSEENARLFAAAPTLLEALHNIAAAANKQTNLDDKTKLSWIEATARKAIAQSEGKQ